MADLICTLFSCFKCLMIFLSRRQRFHCYNAYLEFCTCYLFCNRIFLQFLFGNKELLGIIVIFFFFEFLRLNTQKYVF